MRLDRRNLLAQADGAKHQRADFIDRRSERSLGAPRIPLGVGQRPSKRRGRFRAASSSVCWHKTQWAPWPVTGKFCGADASAAEYSCAASRQPTWWMVSDPTPLSGSAQRYWLPPWLPLPARHRRRAQTGALGGFVGVSVPSISSMTDQLQHRLREVRAAGLLLLRITCV